MRPSALESYWADPHTRPRWTASDWEVVLGQARQTRLLGRLAAYFQDKNWVDAQAGTPIHHLQSALRLTERQQHEVRWEVDRIRQSLAHCEFPIVLLKGAAYLMAGLPSARGRLFSDIDIMVPQDRIAEVESSLFAAGWISDERDAYNQRYYREWMHEVPPLRHIQRNTYIDLHHTITPPTSRFAVDGKLLLEHAQRLPGFKNIFVLAPVDMVLHSAVHLFAEGEFYAGMRDLLDLDDLLHFFEVKDDFWRTLLARAKELNLEVPLFYALFHLKRLFGTVPPEELRSSFAQFSPPVLSRSVMGWALALALRPSHPSSTVRWTGVARWILYVRSHLIRMPLRLAVPHLLRKSWMRYQPKGEGK